MHKVAAVIPVYNGEKYLRQCLDSVCAQTLEDIEIICVDDGSTDSSADILREYEEKDSRLSVIHQENQYRGIACNNGLEHSDSEYVIFWDCDDYFEPQALEHLYNQAKAMDADICACRSERVEEIYGIRAIPRRELNLAYIPKSNLFNIQTNEKYILNFTNPPTWNKLFRCRFLNDNDIRFPPDRHAEDVMFVSIALCCAQRITTLDEVLLHYRVHTSTSQVSNIDSKDPALCPRVYMRTAEELRRRNVFPEQSFVNRIVEEFAFTLQNYKSLSKQREAIAFVQRECMETLCLCPREPGYYYTATAENVVNHLLADTPEGFQDFFQYNTFLELYAARLCLQAERDKNLRNVQKQKKLQDTLTRRDQKIADQKTLIAEQKKKIGTQRWSLRRIRQSRAYRFACKLQRVARKLRAVFHLPGKK